MAADAGAAVDAVVVGAGPAGCAAAILLAEAGWRVVVFGSARLVPAHGPGWVAAGDAALTYDPISAHGLTLALRTGADAAGALLADAAGDAAARSRYGARLARAFDDYRREALRVYRAEQRWPAAPYWRRRHALG